jgi:hypothetical protein
MIALLLAGVLGFGALIAFSAFAPDRRGELDVGAHALSRSAVGYAGFARLLQNGRANVHVSRGLDELHAARLVILTPDAPISEDFLEEREIFAPTLIVLPKWIPVPDPQRAGWALNLGTLDEKTPARIAPFIGEISVVRRRVRGRPSLVAATAAGAQADPGAAAAGFGAPVRLGAVASFQTIEGAELTPRLVDETGRTVLAQWGTDPVYVLSEPDLLNTQGIADFQTARAAAEIIDMISDGDGPIVFDVTLNGFARSRNPLKLALEPPFLAVTLCLLAAALLAGWQAVVRFGPAVVEGRAFDYGKKALADNSAALIRLGRREHELGEGYSRITRELAARAVGAQRSMSDDDLSAHLDRIAQQANVEGSLVGLAEDAREASNSARLLSAARALYQWRRGVVRADR